MLDKELILDKINTIKRAIDSECSNSNYCGALELISLAGRILYETNLYYRDDFLEDSLRRISGEIVRFPEQYVSSNDTVLFWDGFGLNCRGLIQIYLKALCRCRKVVYVTSASRRKKIPDILRILGQAGGKYYFIASNRKTSAVDELSRIVVRGDDDAGIGYGKGDCRRAHCRRNFLCSCVPHCEDGRRQEPGGGAE